MLLISFFVVAGSQLHLSDTDERIDPPVKAVLEKARQLHREGPPVLRSAREGEGGPAGVPGGDAQVPAGERDTRGGQGNGRAGRAAVHEQLARMAVRQCLAGNVKPRYY